ncbi:MAG: hypothetical protein GXP32_02845 [Kiritimatiellaeota bacterium]|nr:hypothetical protein [Kiritimatiellota bacterium]
MKELAEIMNLTPGGYSSCRRSLKARLANDRAFKSRIKKVKNKLDDVKC